LSARVHLAVIVAALILFMLKVALIVFLIRVAPHLGRYRRPVLVVATVVGMLGALSNVLAFPSRNDRGKPLTGGTGGSPRIGAMHTGGL
jgi:hypothetical protein